MKILAFLSLLLTLPLFLVSVFSSKRGRGKATDFLSEFPFEHLRKENRLSASTRLAFFLSLVSSGIWILYQFEFMNFSETLQMMTFFVLIAYMISISMGFVLSLVDPSNEKTQNFGFVGTGVFLLIASALEGNIFIRMSTGIVQIIFGVLCFVIAVAALLLIVNPKLKDWPRLECVSETDGTVSYKRPRPFVMAASEWGIIALTFLLATISSIGLIISSFII